MFLIGHLTSSFNQMITGYAYVIAGFLLSFGQALAQPDIPEGRPIKVEDLPRFLENLGGFLYIIASIIAAIIIIISGIIYMTAGSNSNKVTTAKGLFKSGIIGAIIVFAVGLIISTVKTVAENPFGFF